MMVFIFFKNRIYFVAIFVGNRGLQTLMLGLYVLYSAAFSKLFLLSFHFVFVFFVAWMFSLIPKTDTGLWLGPVEFSPPVDLLSIAGSLFRADGYFPCPSSSWQYGSRELLLCTWEQRLLIHSRYLLSPALLSPHHTTPRIKSTYRPLQGSPNKMFLLSRLKLKSHQTVLSLCRHIIKRCLYFNATNSIH